MAMNKQNLSKMQDTKWHIGYVTKATDDPRGDKRRCVYYRDGMCQGLVKCPGSSHCRDYSTDYRNLNPIEEYEIPSFEQMHIGARVVNQKSGLSGAVVDRVVLVKGGYPNPYVDIRYSNGITKRHKYPEDIAEYAIEIVPESKKRKRRW